MDESEVGTRQVRLVMMMLTAASESIIRDVDADLSTVGVSVTEDERHYVIDNELISARDLVVGAVALIKGLTIELAQYVDKSPVEFAQSLATTAMLEEVLHRESTEG